MIETRASWGHTARLGPPMRLPADEVWIHHTAMSVLTDFPLAMKAIEHVGVQRFGRFSYSYAIHPSGRIGEGAGTTVGAHTKNHNSRAFGIVFMGNLSLTDPTREALDACRWLIAELQRLGHLKPGVYPTAGHRDNPASPSECPGNRLYPHVRGSLRVPWHSEEDDLTPEQDSMLREVHAALVGNYRKSTNDTRSHDLAFPILKTNGSMDWVQKAVERIVKKLQA